MENQNQQNLDAPENILALGTRLETTILKNLIYSEEFAGKVMPFLRDSYFEYAADKIVFKAISEFVAKFNNRPTYEALVIGIKEAKNLHENEVKESMALLADIKKAKDNPTDVPWLVNRAEKFCQDQAIYNAVSESVTILRGEGKKDKGSIPGLLSDALSITFDNRVGHDYIEDAVHRWEYYQRKELKIPFHLAYFNKITNGGCVPKTLNVILGGTGVGKTLVLCDLTCGWMNEGKNVLYITGEMSEEKIAERIDANLLNVPLDQLATLPKNVFNNRIELVKNRTVGKIFIKEYPTAEFSVIHIDSLLKELILKKQFKPDIIVVDYLNIMCSARLKMGANVNSYTYIKSIAEELRGLAVRHNLPVWSATQTNREGFDDSDIGMKGTSESFGLPMTVDFFIALITNDDLEKLGQYMVKQLKNRYRDVAKDKKFLVGVDKSKMRLFDISDKVQQQFTGSYVVTGGGSLPGEEEVPDLIVMDQTSMGKNLNRFKDLKVI